ncbi:MAG: hypothetical protein OEY94_04780 [Alphaproteobacteria bacterium]|nr:hypothetical protein [Alphaproteobacteria bacterium]
MAENGLPIDDVEGVLSVIFAHDLGEDHNLQQEDLEKYLLDNKIEKNRVDEFILDFDAITKIYSNDELTSKAPDGKEYEYYKGMSKRKNVSIAKLIDKSHNLMTMIGVKSEEYMATETAKILQLLHPYVLNASEKFPSQAKTYEALKELLEAICQVNRYFFVDTGQPLTGNEDLQNDMPKKGFEDLPLGLHPLIIIAERVRKKYPETHKGAYAEHEDRIKGDFWGNTGGESRETDFKRRKTGEYSTFSKYLHSTGLYETQQDVNNNLRYLYKDVGKWLNNREYKLAKDMMDLLIKLKAKHMESGDIMKDIPSARHEIEQAVGAINMAESGLPINDVQGVLSLIFVHGLGKNFGYKPEQLRNYLLFKGHNREDVEFLVKDFEVITESYEAQGGPYKNEYEYSVANRMRQNTSIVRLVDNMHTLTTLIGRADPFGAINKWGITKEIAKSLQLLNRYVLNASANFREQEKTYEALKDGIKKVCLLLRYHIVDTGQPLGTDEYLKDFMPETEFYNLPDGINPLTSIADIIRKEYHETHLGSKVSQKNVIGNHKVNLPEATQ